MRSGERRRGAALDKCAVATQHASTPSVGNSPEGRGVLRGERPVPGASGASCDVLGVEVTVRESVADRLPCPPCVRYVALGIYCMGSEM